MTFIELYIAFVEKVVCLEVSHVVIPLRGYHIDATILFIPRSIR
jgi:hypothetical protein